MGIRGYDIDMQRIAIAHNQILAELVKAIKELVQVIKEKEKEK